MYRTGALQYLLSKNGNGNTSKELSELKEQIAILQNNHLHTLEEKLEDIKILLKSHIELEQKNYEKQIENHYKLMEKIDGRN